MVFIRLTLNTINMGNHLQLGSYYGAVQQQQRCSGAVMSAIHHGGARNLPRHSHEAAFFSMVMRGSYREQFVQGKTVEYRPFTVGYHPAGLTHKDEVGVDGVDFFNIEINQTFLRRNAEYVPLESAVPGMYGTELALIATRLYTAFLLGDATPLNTESLVLEMMAEVAELQRLNETTHSKWMVRTLEVLHNRFHEPLTVHEVAREANVHPVHLSRVFRARYKKTLGEYVNKLRVHQAILALQNGEELVDIATNAGFFDQSHFCRVFKHTTGLTPASFRETMMNRRASYFDMTPGVFSTGRSSRDQAKKDASYMLTS